MPCDMRKLYHVHQQWVNFQVRFPLHPSLFVFRDERVRQSRCICADSMCARLNCHFLEPGKLNDMVFTGGIVKLWHTINGLYL
jgi:acetone carboxylase gamma subunit